MQFPIFAQLRSRTSKEYHSEVTSEEKKIMSKPLLSVYVSKIRIEYNSALFYNRISCQSTINWRLALHLYDYSTETTEADNQISGNGGHDFVPIETEVAKLRDSFIKVVSKDGADVRGVHTCSEYRYIIHVIRQCCSIQFNLVSIGQRVFMNFL